MSDRIWVVCNKLTTVWAPTKKVLVIWQFSGPYGITKYSSGWRKDVVNQSLEFDAHCLWCDIHTVFDVWHTHCLWGVTYTLSLMCDIHTALDVWHTHCLWCVTFALSLIRDIHLFAFDKEAPARGCHSLLWAVVLVLQIQQSLSLNRNYMLYMVICLAFHSKDFKSAFRKISVGFFLVFSLTCSPVLVNLT